MSRLNYKKINEDGKALDIQGFFQLYSDIYNLLLGKKKEVLIYG